mgnify:CR=1 FL=1
MPHKSGRTNYPSTPGHKKPSKSKAKPKRKPKGELAVMISIMPMSQKKRRSR